VIANEREYRITKSELRKFEDAAGKYEPGPEVDPRMKDIMRDSLASMSDTLRQELQRYDELRSGQVDRRELDNLHDIATALIEARIASGLTQKNLAERLDLKSQQVQRWEADRYSSVSLDRLWEIAEALDMRIAGTADYSCLAERLERRVTPIEAEAA